MSSVRLIFRDLSINRLWSAWTRSVIVGHVVRRCRKDRSVREVIHSFRQTFFRPRRSLLFYATAACKARDNDEKPGKPKRCSRGISDEELENLLSELDGIEELSKKTLYCENCNKRMVINQQHQGVIYCPCKDAKPPEGSPDGWVPYMEAEDVIIWRKEYKPGQGLFAYKVYGRYKDVKAQDFAAVNIDAGYRRKWDNAVAALAVVERNLNGVSDQSVLHWEVLWPRLFANRDYVYIRRHKEYSVKSIHSPHLFDDPSTSNNPTPPKTPESPQKPPSKSPQSSSVPSVSVLKSGSPVLAKPPKDDRQSVHDNAKKKSQEMYSKEPEPPPPQEEKTEKVYVIISRSCTHPDVPVTRNAIRVSEYWSHMVVKTLDGDDKVGMEFVLTYYDEPAVGGMPSGVTAWATSRATPAFLTKLRDAAKGYASYRKGQKEDAPDFTPFHPETKKVSYDEEEETESVREEDMESSKTGPDMENGNTKDEETQTDETHPPTEGGGVKVTGGDKFKVTEDKAVNTGFRRDEDEVPTRPLHKVECRTSEITEEDTKEETEEEQQKDKGSWWRYIYPPYYLG